MFQRKRLSYVIGNSCLLDASGNPTLFWDGKNEYEPRLVREIFAHIFKGFRPVDALNNLRKSMGDSTAVFLYQITYVLRLNDYIGENRPLYIGNEQGTVLLEDQSKAYHFETKDDAAYAADRLRLTYSDNISFVAQYNKVYR